jgi:hypothetical protein
MCGMPCVESDRSFRTGSRVCAAEGVVAQPRRHTSHSRTAVYFSKAYISQEHVMAADTVMSHCGHWPLITLCGHLAAAKQGYAIRQLLC